MAEAQLIDRTEDLGDLRGWDSLAEAAGRPYSAPGWMLAWWEEMRPPRAQLRVATVVEEGRVVAVAPFYAARQAGVMRLAPLASPVSAPIEPLALPGREEHAGRLLAPLLAAGNHHLLSFGPIPPDSPWPRLLAGPARGRRPRTLPGREEPAPRIELGSGTRDEWWASRSKSFRRDARRRRSRLETAGASLRRIDDVEEIVERAGEFWRLHSARRAGQGGTSLDARAEALLRAAARRLSPAGRLWLWVAETSDRTVALRVCVAAGSTVSFWSSGWDEEWRDAQPGLQTFLAAIDDALDRGYGVLDLGPGASAYKLRLATGEEELRGVTLPVRPSVQAALGVMGESVRATAATRLKPGHKRAIRRVLQRSPG